ncbi:MAG TPA: autotransporter-associated beta strand repeat-containing protein, partial [Phycisphaerae bacterium]|nr:autotransporter-associated beta strand repeat-containing protein [Phycisphaerae bacterium]
MKTPTTLILCAVAVLAFVAVQPIQAAVYTWNTGTENWDTVTSNWTGAGATWVNGNDAVFGGTASSTITINEAGITVNKVTFNVDGDTIAASGGNDLTLSGGNDIVVGTGLTADISAPIVGNVGLEKLGGGKLILSGASTYTGTTHVKEGTLECGINDALPTGANVLMGWGSNSGTPTLDATLDIGNFTATINN